MDYWLFGYGSLIFKEPPHVVERVPGYILNSVRRFWQSSVDHRGTPEGPGRAVTLLTHEQMAGLGCPLEFESDERVYGIAFKIDPKYAAEVREYMDIREKHGYTPVDLPFISEDRQITCTAYIGKTTSFAFEGPETVEEDAEIIKVSEGPSGRNIDYLIKLNNKLKEIHPNVRDDYLEKLLMLCGYDSDVRN